MNPPTAPTARSRRLDDIVDLLIRDGSASPQDLADKFGVSLMTIHRDLDELQRLGLVRKFYGGVSVERTMSFEIAAALRRKISTGVKHELAERAADFVRPGQTIMLDDSTTVASMADRLAGIDDLRIWTNFLPLLSAFSRNHTVTISAVGGRYNPSHESFLGVEAVEAVRRVRVDTVFASATTADESGFFHQEGDIVQLKVQMLRSARRRVLLMDSNKIGQISQFLVGGWEMIDDLVTDSRTPGRFIDAVREQGVSVHLVRSAETG